MIRVRIWTAANLAMSGAFAQGLPSERQTGVAEPMALIDGRWVTVRSVFEQLPVMLPLKNIRVTDLYGARTDPITHAGGEEFHPGVDLGAPHGTAVFPMGPGIMRRAAWRGGYGQMVEIEQAFGFRCRCGHLSQMQVREGDVVSRTTVLGEVGSTGRSTGPHLHMEIWCRDYRIDPAAYLVKAFDVYHRLMGPNHVYGLFLRVYR